MKGNLRFSWKNTSSLINRTLILTILICVFSIVNLTGQRNEDLYWSAEDQMSEIYELGYDQRIPIAEKKKIFRRVIKGTLKTLDSLKVGVVMTEPKLQGMLLEAYCWRYLKRYDKSELRYLTALDILRQKKVIDIEDERLEDLKFSIIKRLAQLYSEMDKEIKPLHQELLKMKLKIGCGFTYRSSRNSTSYTNCKVLIDKGQEAAAFVLLRRYGIWINESDSYSLFPWGLDEQYSRIVKKIYTPSEIRRELGRSIEEINFENYNIVSIEFFDETIRMDSKMKMSEYDLKDDIIRYKIRQMIINSSFYQGLLN